jgi:dihydrofolate reductase
MGDIVAIDNITLDGVLQAPGRPDEDSRDGFAHGGWAVPYNDDVTLQVLGEGMRARHALLFGRRTYQDFASFWPRQRDSPFTEVLTDARKYVVSATLREPLRWRNSTVLRGDVAEEVAGLRLVDSVPTTTGVVIVTYQK